MKLKTIVINVLFYGVVVLCLALGAFYIWAQQFVGVTVDGAGSVR